MPDAAVKMNRPPKHDRQRFLFLLFFYKCCIIINEMVVRYKNKYMERLCTDYKFAIRETNKVMAKALQYCDQALKAYDSVESLIGLKIR